MPARRRLRRRTAATAALIAASMLAGLSPALALDLNGFLRQKGHGDVAISYTSESYDSFWVGDMDVSIRDATGQDGDVETTSTTIWAAYGVTDRLTLIANLPYIKAESEDGFMLEEKDWQDLTVMGAYGILGRGTTFRHDLIGAFGMRTIASNYEANSPVDVGDGTADWLFRLVYQFRWRALYASQQVGFDVRGGDAPNGRAMYTEVGWTWRRATFTGFYQRLIAKDGTDIGDPGFTFPSNEEEFTRAGGKVYGRFLNWLGGAASYFTTLDGRNTGDTSGFSLGVVLTY